MAESVRTMPHHADERKIVDILRRWIRAADHSTLHRGGKVPLPG
jgi:hypothetical protein